MSESRVRENRTHGLMRDWWRHPSTLLLPSQHLYPHLENIIKISLNRPQTIENTGLPLHLVLHYAYKTMENMEGCGEDSVS